MFIAKKQIPVYMITNTCISDYTQHRDTRGFVNKKVWRPAKHTTRQTKSLTAHISRGDSAEMKVNIHAQKVILLFVCIIL